MGSNPVDYVRTSVFYHDASEEAVKIVRQLCDEKNIFRIRTVNTDIVEFILNPAVTNADISAIFLTEEPDARGLTGFHIAERIQSARNNLPIFIRLKSGRCYEDLSEEERKLVTAAYNLESKETLDKAARRYLFGVYYPVPVVNTIQDLGAETLAQIFNDVKIIPNRPFLVRDYVITNYLTSIIPLDISCGKGYLMAQAKENDVIKLISNGCTSLDTTQVDFNNVNQLIGEMMNLFWGKVRLTLHDDTSGAVDKNPAQVPISINYARNYISFGNVKPQLCFRYLVYHSERVVEPLVIDFKVIFNVRWDPVGMEDYGKFVQTRVDNGDLELF